MFNGDELDRFVANEVARVQYEKEEAEEGVDVVVQAAMPQPPKRKTHFRMSLAQLSNKDLTMLLSDLYDEIIERGIDSPPAPCPV